MGSVECAIADVRVEVCVSWNSLVVVLFWELFEFDGYRTLTPKVRYHVFSWRRHYDLPKRESKRPNGNTYCKEHFTG